MQASVAGIAFGCFSSGLRSLSIGLAPSAATIHKHIMFPAIEALRNAILAITCMSPALSQKKSKNVYSAPHVCHAMLLC
jgi:hypothetical protein